VHEFWHVLAGQGEIWRSDGVSRGVVDLETGVSIDIPAGTAFQYRNTGDSALQFLCISMPPWPGDEEAEFVDGPWEATVGGH
jgi:mannose-6-phosphate isomerase-like protein (cupin superfamily)